MTAHLLLLCLVLIAAFYDLRFRRIPNWLVLAGLAAGVTWNIWDGAPLRSLQGGATGLALYLPLYMLRARGAGDVKLLAASGSIVGAFDCLWLFFLTALAAALMALVLVIAKRRTRATLFNIGWMLHQMRRGRAPHTGNPALDVTRPNGLRLPHAAAIAAGAAVLIFMSRTR